MSPEELAINIIWEIKKMSFILFWIVQVTLIFKLVQLLGVETIRELSNLGKHFELWRDDDRKYLYLVIRICQSWNYIDVLLYNGICIWCHSPLYNLSVFTNVIVHKYTYFVPVSLRLIARLVWSISKLSYIHTSS